MNVFKGNFFITKNKRDLRKGNINITSGEKSSFLRLTEDLNSALQFSIYWYRSGRQKKDVTLDVGDVFCDTEQVYYIWR